MPRPRIVDDLADLVLGRQCVGCGRLAAGLCDDCLDGLRGRTARIERPGLDVPCLAATEYMDLSRDLILEYKERGYRSLSRPLGWLLADAVFAIMNSEQLLTCTLVRIPSHPRPLRGFDALGAISREARSALHSAGIAVLEEPLLRIAAPYGALKGLGRTQRQQEVLGAFAAVGGSGSSNIVLVDDVITTGATTAEALAAFARSGSRVAAIAAVAATR